MARREIVLERAKLTQENSGAEPSQRIMSIIAALYIGIEVFHNLSCVYRGRKFTEQHVISGRVFAIRH